MAINAPLLASNSTVALAVVVPVRLGLASSVMPSPLVPLSAAGSSAGAPGVVGGATIVRVKGLLGGLETLALLTTTVKVLAPGLRGAPGTATV